MSEGQALASWSVHRQKLIGPYPSIPTAVQRLCGPLLLCCRFLLFLANPQCILLGSLSLNLLPTFRHLASKFNFCRFPCTVVLCILPSASDPGSHSAHWTVSLQCRNVRPECCVVILQSVIRAVSGAWPGRNCVSGGMEQLQRDSLWRQMDGEVVSKCFVIRNWWNKRRIHIRKEAFWAAYQCCTIWLRSHYLLIPSYFLSLMTTTSHLAHCCPKTRSGSLS